MHQLGRLWQRYWRGSVGPALHGTQKIKKGTWNALLYVEGCWKPWKPEYKNHWHCNSSQEK